MEIYVTMRVIGNTLAICIFDENGDRRCEFIRYEIVDGKYIEGVLIYSMRTVIEDISW